MQEHIKNKIYHVEILPTKQETEKLEADLALFASKFERVMESGYVACLTDNAMGNLAFQGHEMIAELGLEPRPGQVMIHLNTFHTLENVHEILDFCQARNILDLLIISGDGSDRLPRLQPADIGFTDIETVTSVELIRYVKQKYPGVFNIGAAFNPYEPEEHEFRKLENKLAAGAEFVITQPLIEKNEIVDRLLARYPDLQVIIEAWMSKKLHLLSDAVGYPIPEDTAFDPLATLKELQLLYPQTGFYLSILGFKTQYHLVEGTWG